MASPSQVNTYKCAGCGRLKGETNHWLAVMHLYWPADGTRTLQIRPLIGKLDDQEDAICGDACAGKALQTYLTDLRANQRVTPNTQRPEVHQ